VNKQLDVDHWKDMEIWEIDQIPYLFLGYEPVPYNPRPLDDVTTLDEEEGKLYDRYYELIRVAIDIGDLIPVQSPTARKTPLRATHVIKWRKKKRSIKEVKIYIDLEKAIPETFKISTSKDESDCIEWLISLMEDNNSPTQSKVKYHEDAKEKFNNIGTRAFNRAWSAAIDTTGNENFSKPGRKKSNCHN